MQEHVGKLRATYRLQLQPDFGFDEVAGLADYLAELGVSHVYLSPVLEAAPGSAHGYDVVDPTRASEALGGDAGYDRMCKVLRAHGLSQVLDIVPNHMSTCTPHNAWWWDVLRQGAASPYAGYFDIDWQSAKPALRGKVVLAILGRRCEAVLGSGDIALQRSDRGVGLRVYDRLLPLRQESVDALMSEAALRLGTGPTRSADVEHALNARLREINADPQALHTILEHQHYRLMYWRTGQATLNYRRFFDIDTLAALCVERDEVFRDVHAQVLAWVERGDVTGLRVDHPDGLWEPGTYLERLRTAAPTSWIVVEKILEPEEPLPSEWPVAGTTGYDFSSLATSLFVDTANESAMSELYTRFTSRAARTFDLLVRDKKRTVAQRLFISEVERLARLLAQVLDASPDADPVPEPVLAEVLTELTSAMPVYRTYLRRGEPVSARDRAITEEAVAEVRELRSDLDESLFSVLAQALRGDIDTDAAWQLVMRFQQLSGPVMAKGLEDTAFYDYHRLICLNEVGGDPGRFGVEPDVFHAHCERIQHTHPATMVTTSTHDTKRSGDVRARLALLSEIPQRWEETVSRWSRLAEPHRRERYPDPSFEYHLYQTLVGAWPISTERVVRYITKATREAKRYTSWRKPNPDYEDAVAGFVTDLLNDARFVADLSAFVDTLVEPGQITSLAQTLLKLTAPGVPDIYQGHELWVHQLTDPDNRAPPDVPRLRQAMDEVRRLEGPTAWKRRDSGLPKLYMTRATLAVRKAEPACFGSASDYAPLWPQGHKARHAVGYLRGGRVAALVPRLVMGLNGDWEDTTVTLPEGRWRNVFTDERWPGGPLALAEGLHSFPVGLLVREP